MALKPLLVVAFDGGGIRGIFQAHVLRRLEDDVSARLGRPLRFEHDAWLAAGTSTGGILAAGLATTDGRLARSARRSAALVELYRELAAQVFVKRSRARQLVRAKYAAAPLEAALQDQLGATRLREGTPRVLIPAYSEARRRTWWFDTDVTEARATSPWRYAGWTAGAEALEDPPLWLVCRATSAAPTYFPPAHLEDRSLGRWIDGGVGANNPTLAATQSALAELRRRRGALSGRERAAGVDLGPQILVLSLGNGVNAPRVPRGEGGLVQWAAQVPALFLNASATANEDLAVELAQLTERTADGAWVPVMRSFRIAPPAGAPVAALDDATKLGELERLAEAATRPQTGADPATPFQAAVAGIAAFLGS